MHASPLGLSFVPRKMKGKTKGKKTGQGEGDWPRGHGVRVQKPTARARISEKLKSCLHANLGRPYWETWNGETVNVIIQRRWLGGTTPVTYLKPVAFYSVVEGIFGGQRYLDCPHVSCLLYCYAMLHLIRCLTQYIMY